MIYVRSILAGIVAVVTVAFVVPFVALLVPAVTYGRTWNAFNPLSALIRWPFAWFLAAIIFGASFYWEFQDVSRHNR